MHLYWRIQQDLNCMGEFLVFNDPSFKRCFRDWMKKNAVGLAYVEDWTPAPRMKAALN
ncbi:MAG: hypothetical protein M0036_15665 [Desulfobacteraceae bacterium]|nr:hypothetical protein [Desulfobacteraceae bacterium]